MCTCATAQITTPEGASVSVCLLPERHFILFGIIIQVRGVWFPRIFFVNNKQKSDRVVLFLSVEFVIPRFHLLLF